MSRHSEHSQLAPPRSIVGTVSGADLTAELNANVIVRRSSAAWQVDAQLDVFVDAMEARIARLDATAASAVNPVEQRCDCAADVIERDPPVPGKVYESVKPPNSLRDKPNFQVSQARDPRSNNSAFECGGKKNAMRVAQLSWSETAGWASSAARRHAPIPILFFSSARDRRYRAASAIANCARCFRSLTYLAAAPAGKFATSDVTDDEIAAAAIRFDGTKLRVASEAAPSPESSRDMRRDDRPRIGGARPRRRFRSFRRAQCQWQRIRRRHHRGGRRARLGDRWVGRRRR